MTATAAPLADARAIGRHRRNVELALGVLVVLITVGGYVLVALAEGPVLPADLWVFLASVIGLYVVAHLALRRFAPRADGTLLPLAALLNGIGFVTISRLDRNLARVQSVWIAVAVLAFVLTLAFIRDVRVLARYRYTFALLGMFSLLLPLLPGLGRTINGARLWIRIGTLHFQPGEAAKVFLLVFFAGYLVDKREVIGEGGARLGRMYLPSVRNLGPLLLTWLFAVFVMVLFEKDLGSALLFFVVITVMIYMATNRSVYLWGGLVLLFLGAVLAYLLFAHVQVRVDTWLDPWQDPRGTGYQVIQSWYGFGTGGVAGTGLGLGNPDKIPNATTDFIFSAIGEELGLVGTIGVMATFLLFVGSAFRVAIDATRPFSKLFASGIAVMLGFQSFLIVGGVTRLIPLTGITLPFVSYGGSSLIANFVLLALLLRISNEARA